MVAFILSCNGKKRQFLPSLKRIPLSLPVTSTFHLAGQISYSHTGCHPLFPSPCLQDTSESKKKKARNVSPHSAALLEWNHQHRTSIKCSCKPLIKKNACSLHIPLEYLCPPQGRYTWSHTLPQYPYIHVQFSLHRLWTSQALLSSPSLRSQQHIKDGNVLPA